MSVESAKRKQLGLFLRGFREQRRWSRSHLREISGVELGVIKRMEHGVENPTRQDFQRIIKVLGLSRKDKQNAREMLSAIHPRKFRRMKFHLPMSILCHRNRWNRQSYCY